MENHRPRKRFGQNFLRDRSVIERIAESSGAGPKDRVLEIGPGMGALTEILAERAGKVLVMEVDRDLVQRLRKMDLPRVEIHEGDALRLDWNALLTEPPYHLVANLPYNISSQILFRILDHRLLFNRLILMFQKEVGDRICAPAGSRDYGILSVFCQLWFDIRKVVRVSPGSFFPAPKVHSLVLSFEPLSGPRVDIPEEEFFRRVVKGAFSQRRKTLKNALVGAGFDSFGLEEALRSAGIDPRRRAETLNLEEFAALARALKFCESVC